MFLDGEDQDSFSEQDDLYFRLRPVTALDFSMAIKKLKASVDDSGKEIMKVLPIMVMLMLSCFLSCSISYPCSCACVWLSIILSLILMRRPIFFLECFALMCVSCVVLNSVVSHSTTLCVLEMYHQDSKEV